MSEEEFDAIVDEMTSSFPDLLRAPESADFGLSGSISEMSCDEGVPTDEERTMLTATFTSPASSAEDAEDIVSEIEQAWPDMGWDYGVREDGEETGTSHVLTRVTFGRSWGDDSGYSTTASVTHQENLRDGADEVVVSMSGTCITHEDEDRSTDSYPLDADEGE